jgi:MFS-type transporter involved in bile tolerance (Atg22 family)
MQKFKAALSPTTGPYLMQKAYVNMINDVLTCCDSPLSPSSSSSSSSSLSSGAIAGIGIAIVAVIVACVLGYKYLSKKKGTSHQTKKNN